MDRYEDYETCGKCNGEGRIEESRPQRDDPYYAAVVGCDECAGIGLIWKRGGPTIKNPDRAYCKDDQSCCDFTCGN